MVLDWAWLLAHLEAGTPVILVKDYDRSHEKASSTKHPARYAAACACCQRQGATPYMLCSLACTIVHPPFNNTLYGKMHAKLMVLTFKSHIRIVIPSANLVPEDYTMTQNVTHSQSQLPHAATCRLFSCKTFP